MQRISASPLAIVAAQKTGLFGGTLLFFVDHADFSVEPIKGVSKGL